MHRIDQLLIAAAVVLYTAGSACMVAMDKEAGEAALFGAVLVTMAVCTRYVAALQQRHDRGEQSAHADTQELLHDVLVIDMKKVGMLQDAIDVLTSSRPGRGVSVDSGPHRMS